MILIRVDIRLLCWRQVLPYHVFLVSLLLAEIKELKLIHTTCADELEHARAEICDMKFMPCSKFFVAFR
jgi:hypothetical protein